MDVDAEPSVRPGREKGSVAGFEAGEVEDEGLPQRFPILGEGGRVVVVELEFDGEVMRVGQMRLCRCFV